MSCVSSLGSVTLSLPHEILQFYTNNEETKMPQKQLNPTSSILIVGAGTWGCSTALHLARRGYQHVKVLDPHEVPSPIAAGNDVNKIMEHKELKGMNCLEQTLPRSEIDSY